MATKIVEFDLAMGPREVLGLAGYSNVLVIFRWRRKVLGQMWMSVENGRLSASDLWWSASVALGNRALPHMLEEYIFADTGEKEQSNPLPSCSIIICTRNRIHHLRRCLDSICSSNTPEVEIVVVDNAPIDDQTKQLSHDYPVRYILEPRRGLNWARARGALEARGDIVFYIDDDVTVEKECHTAIRKEFSNPEVACVTGLILPIELETEAQELFEVNCGFTRGFERREFSAQIISPLAAANVGAGASMAFRRQLVNELGLFSVELDCGSVAKTAGDTFAFYRLLRLGYRIVYTPEAVVWHRHRRNMEELRTTLFDYSLGTYVYLIRCLLEHGESVTIPIGLGWFLSHHMRHLWSGLRRQLGEQPLSLTFSEIRGVLAAPKAYLLSRRREAVLPAKQQVCKASSEENYES
jgi:glycosyltransferase involved in cell wall biosynthesis